jgi:hypothetical protein
MSRRRRRGGAPARRRGRAARRADRSGRNVLRSAVSALIAALAIAGATAVYVNRSGDPDVPGIARTAYLDEIGRGVCRDIENTHECAAAVEARVLPALGAYAVRRGDTLLLRLAGEDSVVLVSAGADDIDEPAYHLVGMLETGHYIVHGQRYEGDFYLLVDRGSGEEHAIWARPLPSPAGDRILAASADYVAGYNPNGFQIWRAANRRLALEWSFEPLEWGPVDAAWIDNETIRFVREGWCADGPGFCRTPALLERDGARWAVRDTGPTQVLEHD